MGDMCIVRECAQGRRVWLIVALVGGDVGWFKDDKKGKGKTIKSI